jgi:hypothetical protein
MYSAYVGHSGITAQLVEHDIGVDLNFVSVSFFRLLADNDSDRTYA